MAGMRRKLSRPRRAGLKHPHKGSHVKHVQHHPVAKHHRVGGNHGNHRHKRV